MPEAEARAPRMLPCCREVHTTIRSSRRGRGARASDAALLHQACLTDSGQTTEAEARAPRMLPCIRPSGCCPSYRGSRPRRARLGCCLQCHRLRPSLSRPESRPRRARLGCCLRGSSRPIRPRCRGRGRGARASDAAFHHRRTLPRVCRHVEAEARAPRMLSHPTSPWIPRQSCCVFDRWPTAMGETCQILHAIVLTMSKSFTISTIYRDSSGYGVSRGTSPLESVRRV